MELIYTRYYFLHSRQESSSRTSPNTASIDVLKRAAWPAKRVALIKIHGTDNSGIERQFCRLIFVAKSVHTSELRGQTRVQHARCEPMDATRSDRAKFLINAAWKPHSRRRRHSLPIRWSYKRSRRPHDIATRRRTRNSLYRRCSIALIREKHGTNARDIRHFSTGVTGDHNASPAAAIAKPPSSGSCTRCSDTTNVADRALLQDPRSFVAPITRAESCNCNPSGIPFVLGYRGWLNKFSLFHNLWNNTYICRGGTWMILISTVSV